MKKKIKILIIVGVILAGITSCAPNTTSIVNSFSEKTSEAVKLYNEAYVEFANSKFDRDLSLEAASQSATKIDISSLDVYNDFGSNRNIRVRQLLLLNLTKYAKSLGAISSFDNSEKFNESVDDAISSLIQMNKSFTQLKTTSLSVSDDQAGALGTLIKTIGNRVLERKRKKALKKLITSYNKDIQDVVSLLISELDIVFSSAIIPNLTEQIENALIDYDTNKNKLDYLSRLDRLAKIKTLYFELQKSKLSCSSIKQILNKLGKLHQKLFNGYTANGKFALRDFLVELKDITELIDEFRIAYDQFSNTKNDK